MFDYNTLAMRRICIFLVILTGISGAAVQAPSSESLYSPTAAALLSKVGMDRYAVNPYSDQTIEVTMTFLKASLVLDDQIGASWENLLQVSASGMANPKDYTIQIRDALRHYVDERSNLAVVDRAIAYLLQRQNTRMDREIILSKLLNIYQGRNSALTSELLTQIALLEMERADFSAAYQRLNTAYKLDPYNTLAFSKLVDLSAIQETPIPYIVFVGQLRRAVEMNPLDLDIALAYAGILRQVELFESAPKAYQYASDLFVYLNPGQPVPIEILLPWSLCAFQSARTQGQCLLIADQVKSEGRFELSLEAIAGLASEQMGQKEEGRRRLEAAAEKAAEMIKQSKGQASVLPEELCWFYSFVLPSPEQALAWGHEAIAQHPEDPQTRALFAYALVSNGQEELAGEYLQEGAVTDPVVLFTRGQIFLKQGKRTEALPLLKKVVELGPETLIAWRIRTLLKENDSEYVSTIASAQILAILASEFGDEVTPKFLPITQLIKAKLSISGSEYLYGSDMQASVIIENISTRKLIISDTSMFTGRIQIDAEVQGDIHQKIPALVETEIRPGRTISPGQHAVMAVDLMSGPLRSLLRTYPQASLEVVFTLWLDPVEDALGNPGNRWSELPPDRQTIRRRGVELTRDFLMQRLEGVARGKEGQKYRSAELFTGLLAEQYADQQGKVNYRFVRAQPELLLDAIRRLLADEDWLIRLQTLSTFTDVTLPMDRALLSSISDNLANDHWPVRMLALFVLSAESSSNFDKVLDWNARYDPYALNRQMAAALGGQESPERQAEPETLPESDSPKGI